MLQELEQKVAAAAEDKVEFERETLKWKKERNNLLEQLENQKQNLNSDTKRKVALKASTLIDQEIVKVLGREFAQVQIHKEREKLELAERDRLAAIEKVKESEELRMGIEEKNKNLENEIKLVKNEIETAYSKVESFKSDITDLNIQNRSLHDQLELQKKSYQRVLNRV
ncbi:uncharacterized protein LOC121414876 [Lytechinus variegatus]|uniref:uncharacterized protein LOC121414876 n=1 Tax=Lytechinus variegatus TaxID=7654 RepID=UPI001BB0FB10|nr:uncharacterized protein LOC121414876 [Lytechinus variegatus]